MSHRLDLVLDARGMTPIDGSAPPAPDDVVTQEVVLPSAVTR